MQDKKENQVVLIGYSGHGYVAAEILLLMGYQLTTYCDKESKSYNPFNLIYKGQEKDFFSSKEINLSKWQAFIGIGDNQIREKIYYNLLGKKIETVNAIHPKAIISGSVKTGNALMIAAGAIINPLTTLSNGVICNTGCIIDHECIIDEFAHIAPGTVLCGNVQIGKRSFIGANAVVRQNIKIGNDVMIGAGCVVVKNIPDNTVMVGNPAKKI